MRLNFMDDRKWEVQVGDGCVAACFMSPWRPPPSPAGKKTKQKKAINKLRPRFTKINETSHAYCTKQNKKAINKLRPRLAKIFTETSHAYCSFLSSFELAENEPQKLVKRDSEIWHIRRDQARDKKGCLAGLVSSRVSRRSSRAAALNSREVGRTALGIVVRGDGNRGLRGGLGCSLVFFSFLFFFVSFLFVLFCFCW